MNTVQENLFRLLTEIDGICKKYGIDVSNYAFNDLPSGITSQKEGKGIRMELDKIRDNFEKVNSRMLDYFEMNSKEKNKTVPER